MLRVFKLNFSSTQVNLVNTSFKSLIFFCEQGPDKNDDGEEVNEYLGISKYLGIYKYLGII